MNESKKKDCFAYEGLGFKYWVWDNEDISICFKQIIIIINKFNKILVLFLGLVEYITKNY